MKTLINIVTTCRIWRDTQGQELVEYALLGGFIACVGGAIAPSIALSIVSIFGQVLGLLQLAGASDFAAPRS